MLNTLQIDVYFTDVNKYFLVGIEFIKKFYERIKRSLSTCTLLANISSILINKHDWFEHNNF